ncbi:MAG: hypothetical protein IID41_03985 [Planctomycetes bacterium]|nr:hypothetical protein [Planctomycetota bacterium]
MVDCWNIIEHEMTHFLARFKSRTFGQPPNQRVYFGDEHIAPGSNNILTPGIVNNQPHPLVIPGAANQPGTETFEIWDRLRTGRWQDP